MRLTSRTGCSIASFSVNFGRTLSLAMKRPCTWHARMRNSSITGVLRGFGELESLLDRPHDRRQIRPRIEQPHLRFHRERVRALLHDAGAFAVILADDDQRAAGHSAGREIRQRVGRNVGADGGFEGDRAAQRIIHGSRQSRRGSRFRSAVLEMHAQFFENIVRVGQHVHQVRNRRALITRHVGDAGLQQRLGHGENSLAAEFLRLRRDTASGLPF